MWASALRQEACDGMKPQNHQVLAEKRQWHYQVSPEDEAKGSERM